MCALLYPHRHHTRSLGSHHSLSPWGRPPSFAVSPVHGYDTDPFGFSQPFLSLFSDTFSQLNHLSSDLDSRLRQTPGSGLLTSTPKFDIKETESNYILEGELPGVGESDVNLTWADDNTLILKTQTTSFKETKPSDNEPSKQIAQTSDSPTSTNDVENSPAEMSGADPDAPKSENDSALAKTNSSTDVAKPAPPGPTYHLMERTHSTFQRVFSFAGQVKYDEVKAGLRNGVLIVTVPKAESEPGQEKEKEKNRSVTVEDAGEAEDAETVDAEKAKL